MDENDRYERARKRVENLKAFYIHLTVYVLVNIMLIIINMVTEPNELWFIYPLVGWGIGLIAHGLSVFSVGLFGPAWEEKKIKEYMDKDKRK
ncbi:2TM domain-containing protein [Virgibacillus sp. C22-A2]|uniref:2TM domain-containing protein n=1 Tax=Virgibacillus tibetensis TaxID=3042313 RepID=A0ABU6KK75_9BACI|nr:2TM domain-containing protein [Virgibacillus sp. C22-A2]